MRSALYYERLLLALALLMATVCLWAGLGSGETRAQAGGMLTVKLDGRDWTANRIKSFASQWGHYTLTISAYRDGARTEGLSLELRTPDDHISEGTYALTRWCTALKGGLSLNTRTDNIDEDRHALTSGEVTIMSFDRAAWTVSGTFSGTVRNYRGTRTISLSDGRFAGVMLPRVVMIVGARPLVKPCRPSEDAPF